MSLKENREYAPHPPDWVKHTDIDELSDDWKKIIEFFVLYSPCENVSARGKPLSVYGWKDKNPPKEGYLYRRLMESANLVENTSYFTCNKQDEEKDLFSKAHLEADFMNYCNKNEVAYLLNGNEVMCLFKTIRNGFAHGRFTFVNVGQSTYVAMENGVASAGFFEVKARLFLSKETLQKWINIVENESAIEREQSEKELTEKIKKIIDSVKQGDNKSAEAIASATGLPDGDVRKILNELKNSNNITYSRKASGWVLISN